MRNQKTYQRRITEVIKKTKYKPYQKFILAQANLESQYGRSGLAIRCNNYFGMKIPIYRKSTRIRDNDGQCGEYSRYASVEDSARDLVYYLDSINMPITFIIRGEFFSYNI